MITFILGSALVIVALLALALQRYYSSIPLRELRRLAKRGDELAQRLYRAAAYGASLRVLLWLIAGMGLAGGSVLLVRDVPTVLGFGILAVVMLIALVVVPSARLTVHTAQFAAFLAPAFVWLLHALHPAFSFMARHINRARSLNMHSRLYEKEDLTHLLHQQKEQPDNRIAVEELELAHRALEFSDRIARDILQSRKDTLIVNADDSIGPILLDQLHKSGQATFLVYKDEPENIVGSLLMRDAINAKHGGRVFDLIRGDLCFVREDFSLRQVLLAFQKTGHHTAVVINQFEEFLGIVSLDRLLTELVGDSEESENYESRAAIAASGGQSDDTPVEAAAKEAPSPLATEVVE